MAYDYLGLVNDVNRRLNEVALTTTNFSTSTGEYGMIKEAINSSIRFINQHEYEWPFNHVTEEETLTSGIMRYSFPADAKTLDFDTFRIKRNATLGNQTKLLKILTYEEYLSRYIDYEYNTTSSASTGLPDFVFRAPNREFGLVKIPDKAYELVYEYYRLPVDLINATDVPSIPSQFRYILVDGAMYYAYLFRGETQEAQVMQNKYMDEIKSMRSLYVNRYDYARSTVLPQNTSSVSSIRVI